LTWPLHDDQNSSPALQHFESADPLELPFTNLSLLKDFCTHSLRHFSNTPKYLNFLTLFRFAIAVLQSTTLDL
jgi:hypothetical protein